MFVLSEETKELRQVIEHWKDFPVIVEAEITATKLKPIECSADRSGYLIYKADTKIERNDLQSVNYQRIGNCEA